jgi:hypothetical protein
LSPTTVDTDFGGIEADHDGSHADYFTGYIKALYEDYGGYTDWCLFADATGYEAISPGISESIDFFEVLQWQVAGTCWNGG